MMGKGLIVACRSQLSSRERVCVASGLSVLPMGARSAEAIARRAAKRGLTVEEQKKADRESDARRAQREQNKSDGSKPAAAVAQSTPASASASSFGTAVNGACKGSNATAPVVTSDVAVGTPVWKLEQRPEGTGKLKKDAKGGWMCMGRPGQTCGFVNFAYRETCKPCEARRLQPAAGGKPGKGGSADRSGGKKRPREAAAAASTSTGGGAAGGAEGSGGGTAEGSNPPGAAEANAELRKRYLDDPSALSADERSRAEALIARSQRKREEKEARRAAMKHAGWPRAAARAAAARAAAAGVVRRVRWYSSRAACRRSADGSKCRARPARLARGC